MTEATTDEVKKAITSLLKAHWSPNKIAKQLASNESFGKEGACVPTVQKMAEEAALDM